VAVVAVAEVKQTIHLPEMDQVAVPVETLAQPALLAQLDQPTALVRQAIRR
jgi:hypothetical protein